MALSRIARSIYLVVFFIAVTIIGLFIDNIIMARCKIFVCIQKYQYQQYNFPGVIDSDGGI